MSVFNMVITVAATAVVLALSGIGIAGFGSMCLYELKTLKNG